MKVLVDMNLSPNWCALFARADIEAVHWSTIGDRRAEDAELLEWARTNGCILFIHDLDFGALLAGSGAAAPSVIQVRTEDITPTTLGSLVVRALKSYAKDLESGIILTIDETRTRARILPLRG